MEGHCSTGQSPQWAVVPMEEEGEEEEEEEEEEDRQMHNYFTNYHTATCFDTIVSSSSSL